MLGTSRQKIIPKFRHVVNLADNNPQNLFQFGMEHRESIAPTSYVRNHRISNHQNSINCVKKIKKLPIYDELKNYP